MENIGKWLRLVKNYAEHFPEIIFKENKRE